MAVSDLFESSEDLQASIGKAISQRKSLLCFVSDDEDESIRWQDALLDTTIRRKLSTDTVALKLTAGSEQAGFLNAVCPVNAVPAVIVVHNAQVVANLQNDTVDLTKLQQYLDTTYRTSHDDETSESSQIASTVRHLDLPPSTGRMRLPNNAYDRLRELSEQYKSNGIEGMELLKIQLRLLASLNTEGQPSFVPNIRNASQESPTLGQSITDRLLNLPASRLQTEQQQARSPVSSWAFQPAQAPSPSPSLPLAEETSAQPTHVQPQSSVTNQSNSTQSQRKEYIESRKAAEAERRRIKERIEADRKSQREAERKEREQAESARRRAELHDLRKANSTLPNPKATDIRIQVRIFDGSTIRTTFSAEATISNDVRPWIQGKIAHTNISSIPYNLKLVLTPLPNRSIEAGEEDSQLRDLDGVKGSATLIMVPVQGFVESYSGGNSGTIQGVVGTGMGLVGTAASMALGALGRLLGTGSAASSADQPHTPKIPSGVEQQTRASSMANNVKVRTLADQRRDEDDERKQNGSLYNGMGLNVQPRNDDDKRD